MLKKRIIPCLDVKDGKTVKGVNFIDLRDVGDPVILAKKYADEGADELVFLDITATVEGRKTMAELVLKVAQVINIPFTVGGGINSVDDAKRLLEAGADKISVNSAAYKRPGLIEELADKFGKQCVVLAIDTKFEDGDWWVYLNGGRVKTNTSCVEWAKKGVELGAGEILLTSMNNDGTKNGFALDITKQLTEIVKVPVIASGGAGNTQHFVEVFRSGNADAALAAGIFHDGELSIPDLKLTLHNQGIAVRL